MCIAFPWKAYSPQSIEKYLNSNYFPVVMIKGYNLAELTVNLFLTTYCNLGCGFCIAKDYMHESKSMKLMSEEAISEIERMALKAQPAQFNLLGGEPTLHPDIIEIARRLSKTGTPIGLSTNGLWSERFRNQFDNCSLPMEIEISFLGWDNYNEDRKNILLRTFEQLRHNKGIVSIGTVINSPDFDFTDQLRLCEQYGFEMRWSLPEPVAGIGKLFAYEDINMLKKYGEIIGNLVREAGKRGIETWGDIAAPKCAFDEQTLELFEHPEHDVRFVCPPFFDISPDLTIWRCLPLRSSMQRHLTDYNAFLDAYLALSKCECYKNSGVFSECNSCKDRNEACGGGPRIAVDIRNKIKD